MVEVEAAVEVEELQGTLRTIHTNVARMEAGVAAAIDDQTAANECVPYLVFPTMSSPCRGQSYAHCIPYDALRECTEMYPCEPTP